MRGLEGKGDYNERAKKKNTKWTRNAGWPTQCKAKLFRSLNTCILGEAAFCWHKRPLACLCHGAGIGLR